MRILKIIICRDMVLAEKSKCLALEVKLLIFPGLCLALVRRHLMCSDEMWWLEVWFHFLLQFHHAAVLFDPTIFLLPLSFSEPLSWNQMLAVMHACDDWFHMSKKDVRDGGDSIVTWTEPESSCFTLLWYRLIWVLFWHLITLVLPL